MTLSQLARFAYLTSCQKVLKPSTIIHKSNVRFASEVARMLRARAYSRGGEFAKDAVFHMACGLIPAGLLIGYCNLFIGDAVLCDYDPEVYEPEQHEFYKHPIARFMAKYFMEDEKVRYYKLIQAFEVSLRMTRQVKFVNQIHQIQKMEDEGMMAVWQRPAVSRDLREDLDAWAKKNGFETRDTEK